MMADPRKLQPPWRALQPDGNLGAEYGPKTAETYARHCRESADWSFKKQGTPRDHAALIREYMATNPPEVSERQREAFSLVMVDGLGAGAAGDDMGCSRGSVRTYLERLKMKAIEWKKGQG